MIFIGIDPGVSGGIAMLMADGDVFKITKMPATERDILNWFPVTDIRHEGRCAVLERVSASPQMGVVSAFTFGKGYGALKMALTAAYIPFDEVSPIKWQNVMGCRTGGDKNISKRRAQQLFPSVTVTHAIADALLIAEYCRRLHRGMLSNVSSVSSVGKSADRSSGEHARTDVGPSRGERIGPASSEGAKNGQEEESGQVFRSRINEECEAILFGPQAERAAQPDTPRPRASAKRTTRSVVRGHR